MANSTEDDSGRRAIALANSSALQFPGISLCPGTHTSETLVKRPGSRSRQRRHSLTMLELSTNPNSDLIAASLSKTTETLVKEAPLVRIH